MKNRQAVLATDVLLPLRLPAAAPPPAIQYPPNFPATRGAYVTMSVHNVDVLLVRCVERGL